MRLSRSGSLLFLLAAFGSSCATTPKAPALVAPVAPAPVALAPSAESRPTAARFLGRYDRDGDGRVSRTEYERTDTAFQNLDRDKDGVVTARDFAIPAQMPADLAAPFLIVRRLAGPDADSIGIGDLDEAFEAADLDHDGAMDRNEFVGPATPGPDRFAPVLAVADANHDSRLSLDEIKSYALRRDKDDDGRISRRERMRPGVEPRTGWMEPAGRAPAPDFTLPHEEGEGRVTLSAFAGKKPIALIFGSFT